MNKQETLVQYESDGDVSGLQRFVERNSHVEFDTVEKKKVLEKFLCVGHLSRIDFIVKTFVTANTKEGVETPNVNTHAGSSGHTLLLLVCANYENYRFDVVRLLVEKYRANVNCEARYGDTPLSLIPHNPSNELIVNYLLKNKADPNPALQSCAFAGDVERSELLFQHRANPNYMNRGNVALYWNYNKCSEPVLHTFVSYGANLHEINVMRVMVLGYIQYAAQLVAYGAFKPATPPGSWTNVEINLYNQAYDAVRPRVVKAYELLDQRIQQEMSMPDKMSHGLVWLRILRFMRPTIPGEEGRYPLRIEG